MLILPTGEVAKEAPPLFPIPLFRLAFRPMFLAGAAFSVIALLLWGLSLSGGVGLAFYGGGLWWHSHEMLFGFAIAIVTGFLLTAVQTWTKQQSVSGWLLALMFASWLLPRILMIFPGQLSPLFIAATDLIYLSVSGVVMTVLVLRIKQWRNLFFGPLLLLMALVNGVMHWMVISGDYSALQTVTNTQVMMIALVMCIMGGRVFPMFTANGTRTPRVPSIRWLERGAIASMVAAALVTPLATQLPDILVASLYALAGLFNLVRALRWRIWVTLGVPLVWSLHLSYLSLSIGMLGLAYAQLFDTSLWSQALHMLTVGAMGGMILAMISRVSLGHTGRMIQTDAFMASAFVSINLAMLVRAFGPSLYSDYQTVIWSTVLLWVLAYGFFLWRYVPILMSARTDGGPG